ncbi:flagellar protein FlaG [Azospira sp. I09]|jgi:flagellar protein FlaG|uniref:flagellar protein FlaG n=1 Tax=Azospira sp. I09 TaxID=1765049 RepID=UPI0012605E92|nr:flagellar protein FlaG [Azospira sp. I09]BBN90409.1 flagellar protein FlaG [Azospira sp. I09]|eukprot:TRINITY_DN2164_c0_g1_i1.p6 TRINITY_DN2164_c0_g1~~TRINITY_DN2164_c0_g1_i1.p6  ORF type:complete len:131 (+),score=9.40 TRINITY_DN2164_c0_g1_i1:2105-2497(+)
MTIQPLNNSSPPTYPTQTANRSTGNAAAAKREVPSDTSTPDTTKNATVAEQQKPIEEKEALQEATHRANQTVAGLRSDLQFSIDNDTGASVVKLIDVKTKEVIRQIPAQEMLVIAKRLDELKGLLIKERA